MVGIDSVKASEESVKERSSIWCIGLSTGVRTILDSGIFLLGDASRGKVGSETSGIGSVQDDTALAGDPDESEFLSRDVSKRSRRGDVCSSVWEASKERVPQGAQGTQGHARAGEAPALPQRRRSADLRICSFSLLAPPARAPHHAQEARVPDDAPVALHLPASSPSPSDRCWANRYLECKKRHIRNIMPLQALYSSLQFNEII